MQKRTVPFQLEEGLSLQVEVSENWHTEEEVREGKQGFYNQTRDFGEALQVIRPMVDKVIQPLKTLQTTPSRVEMQFGFSFGKDSEVVLNQDQRNSHIRVNLVFDGNINEKS